MISRLKLYDLDHVVNSQSEMTSRWGWAGVGVYRACRFGLQALPHEVKVETVATWGGDYQFCDSGALFPTSVTKRSREVYNGENIPVNIIFVGVEEMYVGIELRN